MAPYRAVAIHTFSMEQVQSCTYDKYMYLHSIRHCLAGGGGAVRVSP